MTAVQPVDRATAREEVLRVEELSVGSRHHRLVHEVSFTLRRGERVGLIGESGSGKSLTALSLLGLLPEGVTATGSATLRVDDDGDTELDLLGAGERRLAQARGRDVAMVFQEPMTALNPTQRVGRQVAEVLAVHGRAENRQDASQQAVRLLEQVRLPDPARTARAYPHQLSGGQRQRVVLAMAMANKPSLLLCDEPTTALDVTVQAQMLDLIRDAVTANDSALLFITHDLAVVASLCDRVMVMYGGHVVESGDIAEVFRRPQHHYTAGLLAASNLALSDERGRLRTIPGTVPAAGRFPDGCVFRTRCPRGDDVCASPPELVRHGSVEAACWHPYSESST